MYMTPFTPLIFNTFSSLFISAALFMIGRSYLKKIHGIQRWAVALLLQGIGWLLMIAVDTNPDFIPLGIGETLVLLSIAGYFHALVDFKNSHIQVRWLYWLVLSVFIGQLYFVLVAHNIVGKTIIMAVCGAILLSANSYLLLRTTATTRSISQTLTGYSFALCAMIMLIQAGYYGFWQAHALTHIIRVDTVQAISYLAFYLLHVITSFGFILMCNDRYIAEKNRTQSELEQAVSLLNATLEATADAILVLDLAGNIVRYNRLFVQLWAIPDKLLVAGCEAELMAFVVNQLIDKQSAFTPPQLSDPQLVAKDYTILTFKDGRVIEQYARPHILNAHALGWVWSFRDVSHRKCVERQLRESEAYLRTIIENEPECIKIVDAQGHLIHINPAGLRMIEADSLEQVIGQPVLKLIAPEYQTAFATMHQQVIEGQVKQLEFEIIGLKGERRYMETHAVPMLENQQTVHLAVTRDISERKMAEKQLVELNRDFVTFLENTSDFIYFKDHHGRIRFCSQTLADITCHQNWRDLVGKHDFEIFPADTAQIYYDEELPIFQHGQPLLSKIDLYYKADGSEGWVSTSKWPVFDEHKKVIGIFGISRDITQSKQAEIDLRIAATIFESQEGMLITDINGVILKVNQAFTRITGYSAAEVIGKKPNILHSGRHDRQFYSTLWQCIHATGIWQGEIWNRRKNGEIYPEWITITAVKTDENQQISHYVAVLTDITERKATEETIRKLAFYDALTQLPNRRLLQEYFKRGVETAQPLAVLMMDLDRFKEVNDNFGHTAGDELLQQVAERIKVQLQEMDMVARLGGDEFVILLTGSNRYAQAAQIADMLIAALSAPFTLCSVYQVCIGASIGISLYPQHGNKIEELMDNADSALYHAKALGRGRFAYFTHQFSRKIRCC